MEVKKPSEKVSKSIFDNKEIKDKSGRVLRLKNPDIMDRYYLQRALGDDAKNDACVGMMSNLLYIAGIDGLVFETPKTYGECLAGLKRLGEDGIIALGNYVESATGNDEGDIEKVKKL
jgi:hypothetical protein